MIFATKVAFLALDLALEGCRRGACDVRRCAGDAIAKTLQTMVTTAEGFIREDFDGGHLQFLFGNKSSIAPNIQRAFDLMRA